MNYDTDTSPRCVDFAVQSLELVSAANSSRLFKLRPGHCGNGVNPKVLVRLGGFDGFEVQRSSRCFIKFSLRSSESILTLKPRNLYRSKPLDCQKTGRGSLLCIGAHLHDFEMFLLRCCRFKMMSSRHLLVSPVSPLLQNLGRP